MNISNKDLNLLWIFHVLYQERSVSAAAVRLALSQPALSHKLNKLRHQFGDPLFIKAPRGLTLTPRAHELAAQVQKLISDIEGFYEFCENSDFLARPERIHLYTTDYIEYLLMPRLLPIIRSKAPQLVLVTHNTRGLLPREELEKGTCDLAIAGFFRNLPDTFKQQRLLREELVVVASKQNNLIASPSVLTLADFLHCEHIITTLTGDLNGLVDRLLATQGLSRHIVAGFSSFSAPSRSIRSSNLLLTCLRSIAEEAVRLDDDLVIYPLPLVADKIEIMQIWHTRTDADRLRRWLREQIQSVTQHHALLL